jgi:hypothetical protein
MLARPLFLVPLGIYLDTARYASNQLFGVHTENR